MTANLTFSDLLAAAVNIVLFTAQVQPSSQKIFFFFFTYEEGNRYALVCGIPGTG